MEKAALPLSTFENMGDSRFANSIVRTFISSAGVILTGVAVALALRNLDRLGFTEPHDRILVLPMQYLYWFGCAAASGLALLCLIGGKKEIKLFLLTCLAASYLAYRFASPTDSLMGRLGSLADTFGVEAKKVDAALTIAFSYLFLGGVVCLFFTTGSSGARSFVRIPLWTQKYKQSIGIVVVILTAVWLSKPLIRSGFPDPTHDGRCHILHLETFSRQFWKGELYPTWSATVNQGFGSPALMFNPPLPCYVGALFWKLMHGDNRAWYAAGWASLVGLMLSGIGALTCFRRFIRHEWCAVIGAVLYMVAPYHLAMDLTERGGVSSFWAFVWMPLIIGALEDLSRGLSLRRRLGKQQVSWRGDVQTRRNVIQSVLWLSLWIACLLLTHVITAVTFAPVVAAFAIIRGWRTLIGLMIAGLAGLALSAIYWLPLVVYAPILRAAVWSWSNGEDIASSVFFPTLEWGKPIMSSSSPDDVFANRMLHIFFGFALTYMLSAVAAWFLKSSPRARCNIVFWTFVLLGCMLMMLPFALPLYRHISVLRHIQVSWRFMVGATFAQTLLIALLIDSFYRRGTGMSIKRPQLWLARLSTLLVLGTSAYLAFTLDVAKYYEGFYVGGQRRVTAPDVDIFDWDSHWEVVPNTSDEAAAKLLFPNARSPAAGPRLLAGQGEVSGGLISDRSWRIEVQALTPALVAIPQYWFPGWTAATRDGKKFPVSYEIKSGLVQFSVPSGHHSIQVELLPQWPEMAGGVLTIAALVGVVLIVVIQAKRRPKGRQSKQLQINV